MKGLIGTTMAAGAALALAACSAGDGDDSARVSSLQADLNAANQTISDLRDEAAARLQYGGLHPDNRISGRVHEEMRAADGSTLTIEFDDPDRPDMALARTASSPAPVDGWEGEVFEGETGTGQQTSATLYRTPLGAGSYLQMGYWQTESTNSSGRTWFSEYGWLMSVRGDDHEIIRDISGIQGQATFEGSAFGIYAISHPAGGQNDSGEFTADATISVDFDDGSATGMIDNFVSAGEQKQWTVELLSQEFDPTRSSFTIARANDVPETQWTISPSQNTPGDFGPNWWFAVPVRDSGDDSMGVVGEFYARYTDIGRMFGTFGAKQAE